MYGKLVPHLNVQQCQSAYNIHIECLLLYAFTYRSMLTNHPTLRFCLHEFSCGGGQVTYTPTCVTVGTNAPLAESVCADQVKPPTVAVCNSQPCPPYWYNGQWTVCSDTCGPAAVQTRIVYCFAACTTPGTATPLADSSCTSTKPATSQPCNTRKCPTWIPSSEWGICSSVCGVGVQSRNLTCVWEDGSIAAPVECAKAIAPTTTQSCQIIPCPHWHRQLWGECSKPVSNSITISSHDRHFSLVSSHLKFSSLFVFLLIRLQCADASGPGIETREVLCRFPHDDPNYYGMITPDQHMCDGLTDSGDGEGAAGVANGKPPTEEVRDYIPFKSITNQLQLSHLFCFICFIQCVCISFFFFLVPSR
jgi:hypothetical protein